MDKNKIKVFSTNLSYYMKLNGKDRKDVAKDLHFPYSSVRDWEKGICYARIDKIKKLAEYFNISTSDLIEDSNKAILLKNMNESEESKLIEEIIKELPSLSKEKLKHIKTSIALLKESK